MKKIKLSGREIAVVRAVNPSTGTPGPELLERTRIDRAELVDIVNSLIEIGYFETEPPLEHLTDESLLKVTIEFNPGYVHELKAALPQF